MSIRDKIAATRSILESLRYERADAVLADVARMLDTPQHLEPCKDTYSSLEGGEFHEMEMLTFKGTVPITFRGNTYHTPLRIHIHPEHPRRAPIVHLEPTAAMRVKRDHPYADIEGLVQVPYLRTWTNRCDLGGLVGSMISVFSEVPPLEAKPSGVRVESSSGGGGVGVSSEDEALRRAIEESQRLASREEEEIRRAIALASGGVDGERKSVESSSFRSGGGGGVVPGISRHASGEDAAAANAARGRLTEKLKQDFAVLARKTAKAVDSAQSTSDELDRASDVWKRQVERLTSTLSSLETYESHLDRTNKALEAFLAASTLESTEDDSSSLAERAAPASKLDAQLLRAMATYLAEEDAIDTLEKAAENEWLSPKEFVRLVRKRARSQFEAKLLADRISFAQAQ